MTRRYRPRHNRKERMRIIHLENALRDLTIGAAAGAAVGALIGASLII